MHAVLTNLIRLPRRSIDSLTRRLQRAYKIQSAADRHAKYELDGDLYNRLCAVPGNTSDRKCRLLFYLADTARANGSIVEIGAYKGKSTAWLTQAARRTGKRLVSIDPHLADSLKEFRNTVDRFEIESVATLHQSLSHNVGRNWSEPIAFLWIDGGHDYECVRQDILDFVPHVTPGGVVVFDDVSEDFFPGVVRAVDELMRSNPKFEFRGQIKSFALFRRKPQ